ncbi:MAG: TMEM175 family protein [Nocardioidaceae bacterium]
MSQPDTGPSRGRDLERLLTFVDAVVAIAITLLVLPLVELTSEVTEHDSVAVLLRTHQPLLWSFLLSFAVISRLWFAQHYSLRHVLLPNERLSLLLVFWALTIVFLPFPTALVARAGDQALTKILYIGTIALSTVTLALMDRVIVRNPQITDGVGLPDVMPAVVNAVLLGLALVISLAVPALSYFPMLLLFLDTPARRLVVRFRRRA